MLKIENLTVKFGERTVIESLSLTLPKSGIYTLSGPSGCGKTTLLHVICGALAPSAGSITHSFEKISASFQEPRLIPWLDLEQNIKFVLSKGENSSFSIDEILEALDLNEKKNAHPNTLSGGMQQRAALARAILHGGDLLLLDEPFSAQDEATKARVIALVKRVNKNGLTLIVTHDDTDAASLGATPLTCHGTPLCEIKDG